MKNALEKKDSLPQEQRAFRKLRLSVTSRCNLFCQYCNPASQKNECSSFEKERSVEAIINDVKKIHNVSPLAKVRISGGEPTLRDDLPEIVRGIKELGIERVGLTTNALFLGKALEHLWHSGLGSINISLDAINPEVYQKMTGSTRPEKSLASIFEALKKAQELGMPVKLNAVICKGLNDSEILPLLDFAISHNVTLRYLELMQMGPLGKDHAKRFVSQNEILEIIRSRYEIKELGRSPSSTSAQWEIAAAASQETISAGATQDSSLNSPAPNRTQTLPGNTPPGQKPQSHRANRAPEISGQIFGIIANHSAPFCSDCDRLRLDSRGVLYGCLSDPRGVMPAQNATAEETKSLLDFAMTQKKKSFEGSQLHMKEIGG